MSTYLVLKAQYELDGAEAAQAEKFAPYEYAAAKLYLDKAREEQGYADFGAAIEYAWKAEELAIQGRQRAFDLKKREIAPLEAPTFVPSDLEFERPALQIIIEESPSAPPMNIEIRETPSSPTNVPPIPEIEEIEIEAPPKTTKPAPIPPAAPLEIEIVPVGPETGAAPSTPETL